LLWPGVEHRRLSVASVGPAWLALISEVKAWAFSQSVDALPGAAEDLLDRAEVVVDEHLARQVEGHAVGIDRHRLLRLGEGADLISPVSPTACRVGKSPARMMFIARKSTALYCAQNSR
jgi:hypothetical protein